MILIRMMGIKLKVIGREKIKKDQVYIIMGNHQSLFDVFVVPVAIPIVFVGVEAAYHFSIPIWGYLIQRWGCIPIDRDNLKSAMHSLEQARKILSSGISIGILPEGHRTRTGEMQVFKKGSFHLAKNAKAPILPFGINGLFKYQHKGSLLLNPGEVTVTVGDPITYEVYKDFSVEELRKYLFEIIMELSKTTFSANSLKNQCVLFCIVKYLIF